MEKIIINNMEILCTTVTTGVNSLTAIFYGKTADEAVEIFKSATEFKVAGEVGEPYGFYHNLKFVSATVYEDGSVGVTMHIMSDAEIRLEELEVTQAEQDEAIAGLIGGVE